MATRLNPYLSFRDETREAMTFYESVFGGELSMDTFASYGASDDPAENDKIMHAQLDAPGGLTLMASDTPNGMDHSPGGSISIALSGEDEDLLRGYWDKLSGSGSVAMPLEKAPWGDLFGMCTDKYGVAWMVSIAGDEGASAS